ncbi:hypothetical protein ACH5RR_005880 [Cinchona calisaya]|uniref:MAPK kinase substrate protein n=1 Tax=Cinchona calisaya TaxID=153742 RepID=A0ABD3AMG0_9GENT
MAGLQRSEMSFRRQGSSGLVWDDKFIQKLATTNNRDDHDQQERETKDQAKTSSYRTVNVAPVYDPPSPKVSAGCCAMFGKPAPSKSHKRRHRLNGSCLQEIYDNAETGKT